MATIEIELPLPPRVLSPNVSRGYMTKARAKKAYVANITPLLNVARTEARSRGVALPLPGVVECGLTFVVPRLDQDADNLVAQFKVGIDALARWGFIENDNAKHLRYLAPIVERGKQTAVRITLSGGAS